MVGTLPLVEDVVKNMCVLTIDPCGLETLRLDDKRQPIHWRNVFRVNLMSLHESIFGAKRLRIVLGSPNQTVPANYFNSQEQTDENMLSLNL